MIKIIDYGLGNIQAFISLYRRLNILIERASKVTDFEGCTHLILPGVGSFDHAMTKFNNSGLRDMVEHLVFEKKIPIVGVCVGMQMLANSSDEGKLPGLGWIPGKVKSFSGLLDEQTHPLPHMGWNTLTINKDSYLISSKTSSHSFYFLHSFFFEPLKQEYVVASANYGFEYPVVIAKNNIYGIQCHPEKSHHSGIDFLKAFSEI